MSDSQAFIIIIMSTVLLKTRFLSDSYMCGSVSYVYSHVSVRQPYLLITPVPSHKNIDRSRTPSVP